MAHPAAVDRKAVQAAAADRQAVNVALRAYAQAIEVTEAAMPPALATIIVHERLGRELTAAKAAYQARRLDQMCRHIEKCRTVLLTLSNGVKLKPGAAAPLILRNFYLHLFRQLLNILRHQDVPAAFDGLISTLDQFCSKLRTSRQESMDRSMIQVK